MYHNFIITKILKPDEAHSVDNVDTVSSVCSVEAQLTLHP